MIETIIKSMAGITVTYPTSGSVLVRGNTYNVTWTGTDSGSVKIELYKDGVFNDTLMTSSLNDGVWKWAMSATSTNVGSGYTIKITHLTAGTFGESQMFSISPATAEGCIAAPDEYHMPIVDMCVKKLYVYAAVGVVGYFTLIKK